MIPASRISPVAYANLREYTAYEIRQALAQRQGLEQQWLRHERMYRAIPEFEVKTLPFYGAANLVIPVIATDVEVVFSRLMGILFATDNLWSCKALNENMIQFAARLQEFLQWAQHNELGVYDAVADWTLEITKLGTGVLKQRFRREEKKVYQFRETEHGTVEQFLTILLHDHPEVRHVSLWDFLVPAVAENIPDSPWCAERLGLTWGQLLQRQRQGIYTNIDVLRQWRGQFGPDSSQIYRAQQQNDLFVPSFGDRYEIWEKWLDWDISGIGEPQAIVYSCHLPTGTPLRVDYNPWFNQEKPYSAARYMRQAKRFYGIGLCEMLDHFQEEVTAKHNQRLDRVTIANSPMLIARNGIGIKEDEPIVLGRWFLVDNMEDIKTLEFGQTYDNSIDDEQFTLQYGMRRTGVNEWVQGSFEPGIGYSTATVGVQQLQQSVQRLDQTLREMRLALSETGTRVVELYQQFNIHGKEYLAMGQEDGAMVHAVLQFPLDMIRASVGIELTATSASANKEIEIRTNTIIMQMTTAFFQQAMQALSYVVNPMVPEPIKMLAWQMVQSQNILLRRMLDTYGVQDLNQLVPELGKILNGGQQQLAGIAGTAQQAANAGANPLLPGPLAAPGMGTSGGGMSGAATGFPLAA